MKRCAIKKVHKVRAALPYSDFCCPETTVRSVRDLIAEANFPIDNTVSYFRMPAIQPASGMSVTSAFRRT